MTPCTHRPAWLRRGQIYDYCCRCGAVRRRKQPGEAVDGPWHTCADCLLQPIILIPCREKVTP